MKRMPRILLVNKFYYPRGGDCICMINLEALLRRLGYEVDLKIKQERLAVSLD